MAQTDEIPGAFPTRPRRLLPVYAFGSLVGGMRRAALETAMDPETAARQAAVYRAQLDKLLERYRAAVAALTACTARIDEPAPDAASRRQRGLWVRERPFLLTKTQAAQRRVRALADVLGFSPVFADAEQVALRGIAAAPFGSLDALVERWTATRRDIPAPKRVPQRSTSRAGRVSASTPL